MQGFKYLDSFFKTLNRLHDVRDNHHRKLHDDKYIALILLYFFTPLLASLRGIQRATELKVVQERLGIKKTSLTSLSEAQVFDAKVAQPHSQRTRRPGASSSARQGLLRLFPSLYPCVIFTKTLFILLHP